MRNDTLAFRGSGDTDTDTIIAIAHQGIDRFETVVTATATAMFELDTSQFDIEFIMDDDDT
ncbi:hypothetical protein D1872_306930 [compost metagenome]